MWKIFDFSGKGFPLPNSSVLTQFIAQAGGLYAGKHCIIHIYEFEQDKTLPQLGYYWGIVLPEITTGINELGAQWTEDQTHTYLKSELGFNDVYYDPITGEEKYNVRSLSDYSIDEMSMYIDSCITWAKDFLAVSVSPADYTNTGQLLEGK